MKQSLWIACIITLLIASCNFPTGAATPTPVTPTGTPVITATPTLAGHLVTINHVSLTIPDELARDALLEMVSAATDGAPWELSPAHVKVTLTGYPLENKFHLPQIFVYPANEYASMNPNVGYQLELIKKLLAGSPILRETLPRIPWFNAEALIAANVQMISFQNGRGIRALTEYAQYYAPINNNELLYQFAGLTTDEKYYIIAILPINAPFLPENEKPDAPVPAGGIPIPTDVGPNDGYYAAITEKLVSLDSESYTPSLSTLDALIQSILITNP